ACVLTSRARPPSRLVHPCQKPPLAATSKVTQAGDGVKCSESRRGTQFPRLTGRACLRPTEAKPDRVTVRIGSPPSRFMAEDPPMRRSRWEWGRDLISSGSDSTIASGASLRLERLGIVPRFRRLPVDVQVGPNRFDKRCLSSTRADLCAISAFGLYAARRSSAALTGPYSASEFLFAGDLPPRQRAVF